VPLDRGVREKKIWRKILFRKRGIGKGNTARRPPLLRKGGTTSIKRKKEEQGETYIRKTGRNRSAMSRRNQLRPFEQRRQRGERLAPSKKRFGGDQVKSQENKKRKEKICRTKDSSRPGKKKQGNFRKNHRENRFRRR